MNTLLCKKTLTPWDWNLSKIYRDYPAVDNINLTYLNRYVSMGSCVKILHVNTTRLLPCPSCRRPDLDRDLLFIRKAINMSEIGR